MDPNEALRLIRAHIKQMRVEDETREDGWIGRLTQQARDIAETFEGLDKWLSRDGFLPHDWVAEEDKSDDPHDDDGNRVTPEYDPHGGSKHRVYEEN